MSCLVCARQHAADLLLGKDLGGASKDAQGHEVFGIIWKDVLIGKIQFACQEAHSLHKIL